MGTFMAAISFALKASCWLFQEPRDVAPLRPQTFSAHLRIFQPCAYWGWLLRACRTSILLGNGFPFGEFHVFLASLPRKATFYPGRRCRSATRFPRRVPLAKNHSCEFCPCEQVADTRQNRVLILFGHNDRLQLTTIYSRQTDFDELIRSYITQSRVDNCEARKSDTRLTAPIIFWYAKRTGLSPSPDVTLPINLARRAPPGLLFLIDCRLIKALVVSPESGSGVA